MVKQYENELGLLKMRQDIKNFNKDSLAIASIPKEAVQVFPALESLITPESITIISEESFTISIAGRIIKFIKTVLKTIYRFIRNIFTTKAGDIDRSIKTAKRKMKLLVSNTDAWVGSSLVSSNEGLSEIVNNMMLFKILSNEKFDYLEWLSKTNHIEESSDFITSYSNVVSFINDDGIRKYRDLYYNLRELDGMSIVGVAPEAKEIAYPISISKDRITFLIMEIKTSGTGLSLSKVRDIHLVLNYTEELTLLRDKDKLSTMLGNVITRLDKINSIKGLVDKESISDEDIINAMDKIAFYYMRDTNDKKTQKAIAGFLTTLSDACSLSITNHLHNLESVGNVMNEIINYERL